MLNIDHKILSRSKALASRLKETLSTIVSEDQTGFMEGRNISTNIRKTIEVIEYCKNKQCPVVIMTMDFEKCFDRIEHTAIRGSLENFNFGPTYIKWIMLLLEDFELCTQNNGLNSEWFQPTRSVHQGCNIVPFLFLLCGEVMAYKIKENKDIHCIEMYDIMALISQFANDTTLFLTYDTVTLDAVVNTLQLTEANTGLKVSYDKACLYRMGSLAGSSACLYTQACLKWTNDPIYILGVHVSNDSKVDYDEILVKTESVLNAWIHRGLTLMGKILYPNKYFSWISFL